MLSIETDWQPNALFIRGIESNTLTAPVGDVLRQTLIGISPQLSPPQGENAGPEVLQLDAASAMDWLLAPPTDARSNGSPAPALSPATVIWRQLAQFVWERIAHGQFYPSVELEGAELRGAWRLLVGRTDELQWLRQAADALTALTPGNQVAAEDRVESFLNATSDAMVRRSFNADPFFAQTAARCHVPGATSDMLFLGSLLTTDFALPNTEFALVEKVRTWTDALQDSPTSSSFRLLFRLMDPPDGDQEHWRVEILMSMLSGNAQPTPITRLWETGQKLPPILGRNLTRQRQTVAEQLRQAAEIWPALQNQTGLETMPLVINAAEAVAFARQWSSRLVDGGFAIELPAWCHEARRELSIQLAVRPVDPHEALFFGTDDDDSEGGSSRRGDSLSSGGQQVGLDALLQFDWRVAIGAMQLTDEQCQALLQARQPLVKFEGQWVQIDVEAAEKALQFIQNNGDGTMTLADALRTVHSTSSDESGLSISGMTGADWIGQLLLQSPDAQLQAMPQPPAFIGELRPYQLRGLQWLMFLQRMGIGACLADDMGLGKTIQFIALLLLERQLAQEQNKPKPGPTLLFAPTSVLGNWSYEVQRFAPTLSLIVHHGVQRLHGKAFHEQAMASDLIITTYALAGRDSEDFALVPWRRLALDEAQKVKNPAAAATQAIRSIPASYRVALTGTPIENHLSELWSIMDILNPGLLGTATTFRERFATPIERLSDQNRAAHLRDLIKPFVLRRTKADPTIAGDLPDKLEMKVFCNLTVEQAALYQRITDEMLGQIDAASGIRRRGLILAALTRLKQVCDHPNLLYGKIPGVEGDPTKIDARSGKCERLVEMLEEVIEEGDAALVFTQFKEMGDILEKLLIQRLGVPVLYLHGGTPASRRDAMIRQFQDPNGGIRVFLLSLRAGGLGLNLTHANHVFHFDRWWNPAVEQQATDRAHRIGQLRQVQVHKYVCIGTMEERIDKMLTEKMRLADRIITSGDDWLTSLSTDDLRKTLELSSDAVEDYSGGGA